MVWDVGSDGTARVFSASKASSDYADPDDFLVCDDAIGAAGTFIRYPESSEGGNEIFYVSDNGDLKHLVTTCQHEGSVPPLCYGDLPCKTAQRMPPEFIDMLPQSDETYECMRHNRKASAGEIRMPTYWL